MKLDPEKNTSCLAPLADAYGPTQAEADRLLAKLEAAIAQAPTRASSSDAPANAASAVMTWQRRSLLLGGLSCLVLAGIGGAFALRETPRAVATPAAVTTPAAPPRVASTMLPAPSEARHDDDATPALRAVSTDELPAAAPIHPAEKAAKKPSSTPLAAASEGALSPDDTLEREARLLAEARRRLKGGDGDGSLALLDQHAREFPHGRLAGERMAERIVVLCNLGRTTEALGQATAFLEGRPKGALTRRVEGSCAGEAVKAGAR